jgi:hypothetical protein
LEWIELAAPEQMSENISPKNYFFVETSSVPKAGKERHPKISIISSP